MEPFDPAVSTQVAGLYFEAERQIVQAISARLQAGALAGEWRMNALKDAQVLSKPLRDAMWKAGQPNLWVETAGQAYLSSAANASLLDVRGGKVPSIQALTAVRSVATEMADTMNAVNRSILRRADDTYARIIGKVVGQNLAGEAYITRAKAAQQAMDLFTKDGVGKFADRNGRQWRLGDYVDMATRTGLHRAQLGGHEAALDAAALDLVAVQPGPRPCPICDKWARAVLTRSGETGTIEVTNEVTGNTMKVRVDGTLNDARRAGFQHPNCRCSLRAFIPGVTTKAELERPPYDAAGYRAQQTQRGLENDLRAAKMREAAAVDPAVKAAAKAKVREAKGKLDNHLGEYQYLKRRTDRQGVGPKGRFRPGQGGVAPDIKTPPPGTIWDIPVDNPRPTLRPGPVVAPKPKPKPKVAPAPKVDPVSKRPAITPLLDGKDGPMPTKFSRLATAESMEDIATKANPGYDRLLERTDYGNNCTYVVNAVEMRARGYDVVARRTAKGKGRPDTEYLEDWVEDRPMTNFTWGSNIKASRTMTQDRMNELTADMPDGARGYVRGLYRDRGGHIFNWEKVNGKLVYHEGQVSKVTTAEAYDQLGNFNAATIKFIRVDDLTPSPALLETVQATGDLALTGRAALVKELEWVEERAGRLLAEAKALEDAFTLEHGTAYEAFKIAKVPRRMAYSPLKLAKLGVSQERVVAAVQAYQPVKAKLESAASWRADRTRLRKALKDLPPE